MPLFLFTVAISISFLGFLLTPSGLVHTNPIYADDKVLETRPEGLESDSNGRHHKISFESTNPALLATAEIIDINVATYESTPIVTHASLKNAAGTCLYGLRSFSFHHDNDPLRLRKIHCNQESFTQKETLILEITTLMKSQLAIWTIIGPQVASTDPKKSTLLNLSQPSGTLVPIKGEYSAINAEYSRLDLLDYMWGWSKEKSKGRSILVLALTGISLCAMSFSRFGGRGKTTKWLVLGSMTLFLSLIYAYIVPPLQSPDEPDHILSYIELTGSKNLAKEFLPFAQKGHFERIKFHAKEHFQSEDVGTPFNRPFDGHVGSSEIWLRSPLLAKMWIWISPYLQNLPPGEHIFALRLFGILIFMGSFLTSALVLNYKNASSSSAALPLLYLTWPILYFFVIHISNYSLTASFSLITASLSYRFCLADRHMPVEMHFVLGFVSMLLFSSSASGLTALAFWAPILAFYPARNFTQTCISASVLCGGLICGFFIVERSPVSALGYLATQVRNLSILDGANVFRSRMVIILLSLVVMPICLIIQSLVSYPIKALSRMPHQNMYLQRILGLTMLALLAISITIPAITAPHFLPDIEHPSRIASSILYALEVLNVMARNLGLGPVDFYLSSSFWGGIGWLESDFDNWFVCFLRLICSVGVLMHLWHDYRSANLQGTARNICFVIALSMMLVGGSHAVYGIPINLHGRYLIPFYCLYGTLSAVGWWRFMNTSKAKTFHRSWPYAYWSLLALTQGYGMTFIILRYFG